MRRHVVNPESPSRGTHRLVRSEDLGKTRAVNVVQLGKIEYESDPAVPNELFNFIAQAGVRRVKRLSQLQEVTVLGLDERGALARDESPVNLEIGDVIVDA